MGDGVHEGHDRADRHVPARREAMDGRVGPLRDLLPSLPIIASSGYSDDPVMAAPTQFGFSACLRKPFRLNELADLLTRLIAQAAVGGS
jgi:CheY-like chemotaxis protein